MAHEFGLEKGMKVSFLVRGVKWNEGDVEKTEPPFQPFSALVMSITT